MKSKKKRKHSNNRQTDRQTDRQTLIICTIIWQVQLV